jgi:hypothetical protein
LHDTEESFNEPYIALSYCWGTAGFFKTTSKNIDDLRNSIELESMPVVIQDAVKVARELNIRYLWIDALCIIQDSTEDWAKESLKMGKIYQNAYLTIVASSSTGVTESFLRERPVVSSLKLPFQSPNMEAPGFINLRHYSNHPSVQNNPGLPDISRVSREHWQQPIHDRAWTLQERFMSTRVVFFDPTQLLFECRCTRRFEGYIENVDLEGRDYPGQLSTGRRGNDNFADNLSKSRLQSAWTRETVYNPNPLMYADKYAQVEFNEHWNRVLIDFGLRHLTYSSDALFALSAVAKKFGADLGDIYLAGIWMNDFRKGLLWNMRWSQESPSPRVAPYMSSILEALPEHQRAIASSGPSWSWVSRFTQPDKINFSVVASQKPLHDERDVQLVEYFAIPLFDNDMFGPLKIGMLTLKGYMARVDVIFSYASPGPEFGGVLLLRAKTVLADQSTAKIKCCFDSIPEMVPVGFRPEDGAVADPFSLQALIISGFSVNRLKYKYSSGKRPIYYGLLLKPTPFVSANGEFVYQRVGVFSLDPEITEETFEDFIGFDVFTPTTETWTGWAERQIDII